MAPGPTTAAPSSSLLFWFNDLPADTTGVAGGKGASLSRLAKAGFPVPPGFVVCAAAFAEFLDGCGGCAEILALTNGLDVHDTVALDDASQRLRQIVLGNPLPAAVAEAVQAAYLQMGESAPVAVRSSAVCEDSKTASFAGQQESFLNVRGTDDVSRHVQRCWASFFAPRALFYRAQKGTLTDTGMAVVVQEMILGEKSGVMFTIDPVHRRCDHMVIEAVLGLGEGIVSGLLTPDHYVLDRASRALLRQVVARQTIAVADNGHVPLPESEGCRRKLTDAELSRLLEIGLRLESLFGSPQDVEWCIRGDELFLLQSRPITTLD